MPWVYFQREGTLVHDGVYVGTGYSGHGVACNRPEFEKVRNEGPIPKGSYGIGHAENTSKGSYSMRLTPVGHRAHGRTGFMIHGDSRTCPGSASEGCIILPLDIRKKISNSGDNSLTVM